MTYPTTNSIRRLAPFLLFLIASTFGFSGSAAAAPVRGIATRTAPISKNPAQTRAAHSPPAPRPTNRKPVKSKETGRVGLRAAFRAIKDNFQLYKGDRVEAWANRFKVGRSDFNPKLTVKKNLAAMVAAKGMDHYYAKINGKEVLHIVVTLGKGKRSTESIRNVLRRVGGETLELNYKGATAKNPYGHVAVRVGNGALYDLTGTQGLAKLPKFMEATLTFIRGTPSLTFARKRNLRRFMESRSDGPSASASVYYGMLFAASPKEISQTQHIYNERIKQATQFKVSGGDAKKGEYSCAQFLTENVPFFNSRGVGRNVSAKATTSAAKSSLQLEAVVVYKMPSVATEAAAQFP